MKNILGNMAYFIEGAKRLGTVQPCHCRFILDDEEIAGEFILGIVANSQSIGGIKLRDMEVRMDDGLFEVILLPRPENLLDVMDMITSVVQQEGNDESLILRKARKVNVKSESPIAWTLDGEFGGMFRNVEIENLHRALQVLH
jgi:diacylglycerol kinase family enzyme